MELASVFFITLRTRADRRKKFETWALRPHEPWSRVTGRARAFVAERHPRGSIYGCWHSHMSAMKLALEAGAPYALIMEDDAVPTAACRSQWARTMADVESLLASQHKWDMIGLGGLPLTWIYRCESVEGTQLLMTPFVEMHAYLVSADFMRRAVVQKFTGGMDYAYARRARMFLVKNELFEQDASCGSDITLRNVVSVRKWYKAANMAWANNIPMRGRTVWTGLIALAFAATAVSVSSRASLARQLACAAVFVMVLSVYIANEYVQDASMSFRTRSDLITLNGACPAAQKLDRS